MPKMMIFSPRQARDKHRWKAALKKEMIMMRFFLQLDSFEGMLKEANEDRSATSFHGRIVLHTLEQLFTDFFPHWVYKSGSRRFVRGESCEAHEVPPAPRPHKLDAIDQIGGSAGTGPVRGMQPSAVSKYMARAMSLYSGYIGVEHIEAMIRCAEHKKTNTPFFSP
jgi:hypothetical protein